MAQEWYLMDSKYDTVSGFESDDFNFFASDAFDEALMSSMGTDVEICNYDLSIRESARVIMQGNVQDTKLNALQRKMLARIGTCSIGQYVYYKNRYWLITGLVDDNGMYEKAVLALCNYLLTWQDYKHDIIQRWANISSASQYNNGELNDKFVNLGNDKLMVLTSRDDDALLIPHGKRFIIDARRKIYEKKFSEDVRVDTSNPLITYKFTRIDNVLYDYQDSGHAEFLADQDEKHDDDGYYVINGKGYWLCGATKGKDKTTLLSSKIECESFEVFCGIGHSVFTAKFFDENGEYISSVVPQWSIDCDFADRLNIDYLNDSILISTNDNKLINKSFVLSLSADGYEPISSSIQVRAFL